MANLTSFLVDGSVAWDDGRHGDGCRAMVLESFDRVNHDGGTVKMVSEFV